MEVHRVYGHRALNSTPGTRGPDSHSSYVGLVTCVGIRITVVFYIVPAQTLNQEKKGFSLEQLSFDLRDMYVYVLTK